MVKQRKYIVKRKFEGFPKRDDYEIVETELSPIRNGEALLKTEWVSVDPYQRLLAGSVPYDTFGYQVGLVMESKDPRFPEGTRVVSHNGWCDYSIISAAASEEAEPMNRPYKLPDLKGLPISLGVGCIGMPGATAYFGLLEVCQPKPGETVVVTGAAGAVGSIVGQIAKMKGCKVIGFAGSDDKCQWLEKDLGFDKAMNYKTVDVAAALKQAAPNGVDCYFDNVGGEISSQIIFQMNVRGRVACCGSISSYNDSERPKASILQPSVVGKQLRIQGFVGWDWMPRWSKAFAELVKWTKSGQLKVREHVTEGFDNIYDAFVGMLDGENTGKAVIKIVTSHTPRVGVRPS